MRSFLTAAVTAVAALAGSAQAATCSTATLATLLTNQYLSTCSSDSGYSFLTGVQPTPAQAALMCQSSACQSLLADVLALGLEECQLPIGNKINLFADLIDYVRNQCVTPTPTPTPTPEPTTEAPTPTPAPTVASCTAAQLRVILLSTYRAQCSTDSSYSFTLPYVPTAEQVAAMCASSSCVSLFAEAQAAGLTECRTPTGGKILWLAELIDYVPSQCTTDAPTPAPTTEAPTPSPTTEAPTPSPTTEAPTPSPTDSPNPTTSTPTSGPTATPTPEPTETPEPTTPPHDSC